MNLKLKKIKKVIKDFRNFRGASTLLLVFVVTVIIFLIIFALQLLNLLGSRRTNQVRNSQTAFFAAEGVLYESIRHFKNDPEWFNNLPPVSESEYSLDGTSIYRIISKGDNRLEIDVTAESGGARRKLSGIIDPYFGLREDERLGNDIVFLFDHSGSMTDLDPVTGERKMDVAKRVLKDLVCPNPVDCDESIFDPNYDWIGLVGYGSPSGTSPVVEFSNNYSQFIDIIDGIDYEGGTCFTCAFEEARLMFESYGRGGDVRQVVVFLTDGKPTYASNDGEDSCLVKPSCSGQANMECLDRNLGMYLEPDEFDDGYCRCRWSSESKAYLPVCPLCEGIYNPTCVYARHCPVWEEAEECTLDYFKNNLEDTERIIYTIGFGDPDFGEGLNEDLLRNLVHNGGVYRRASAEDLDEIFESTASRIILGSHNVVIEEKIPD